MAIETWKEVLSLEKETPSLEKETIFRCNNGVGNSSYLVYKHDDALKCFKTALDVALDLSDSKKIIQSYYNIAVTLDAVDEIDKALEYCNKGSVINPDDEDIKSLRDDLIHKKNCSN